MLVPRTVLLWMLSATLVCMCATDRSAQAEDIFRDRVVPVIQKRCLSCHNSVDHKGGFALQSADELSKSGFVEASQPSDSHLLTVLKSQEGKRPAMPKNAASNERTSSR